MASNPVTPPSKQNGRGLQDPFTDEKNGDRPKPNGDRGRNKKKINDQEADGADVLKETLMLFYAYARRSDNHWASRYLLTFSSAQTCNEWWTLVQAEYPDQGERHGPQLFSFVGDEFPKKPATSKKFQHLKTKWFYSQFGDASGAGGRAQEIIPLQDWEGKIVRGSEDAENKKTKIDKGKGKAADMDDDGGANDEHATRRQGGDPFDFSGLAASLQSAALIAETTNAQVSQLIESQACDHDIIHQQQEQSQRDAERMQRIEALVEENAAQLQALSKSHIKAQQQNRELAEQNGRVLRELKRQRTQTQALVEQIVKEREEGGGGGSGHREKEQGEIEAMHVVVHPPPRKIDRPLVGYAYHSGVFEAVAPKEPIAKGSPAKRPGVSRTTTTTTTLAPRPKGATGK